MPGRVSPDGTAAEHAATAAEHAATASALRKLVVSSGNLSYFTPLPTEEHGVPFHMTSRKAVPKQCLHLGVLTSALAIWAGWPTSVETSVLWLNVP